MKRIYLDYAATTPADPAVVDEMVPYFTNVFGNPSSIHGCGQEAGGAVAEARTKVAKLLGCEDEEIVFTSGGTESDNSAIEGIAYASEAKGNHIVTSSIEHHAVLETCAFLERRGFKVTYLPVDKDGLVNPDDLKNAITKKTILISIMHANNEIGTIEPLAEISKIAREYDIPVHTDAVQTAGHIPFTVDELGVSLLSMSAHKLYGPKGVGALYVRKGTKLVPFMHGGAQERERRASTENVPAIVGFGKAAEMAAATMQQEAAQETALRDRLIAGLMKNIEKTKLNGHPTKRLPNNVNLSVEFIEGEAMCLTLDLAGICSSTGSACSSGSAEPSHVLRAIGLPHQQAYGSLRFSLGKWTTEADVDYVIKTLPPIVARLRAMSPLVNR